MGKLRILFAHLYKSLDYGAEVFVCAALCLFSVAVSCIAVLTILVCHFFPIDWFFLPELFGISIVFLFAKTIGLIAKPEYLAFVYLIPFAAAVIASKNQWFARAFIVDNLRKLVFTSVAVGVILGIALEGIRPSEACLTR